jgi:23S rRNA pseudouridine1911/1915/1917 synthase
VNEESPPQKELIQFAIQEEDLNFKRLDQAITKRFPDLSRTKIKKLFEQSLVYADQYEIKLNKLPPLGTKINILVPPPEAHDLKPVNINLDIIYEDEYLIAINKPAGLVVHPAPGNWDKTLVHGLLYHFSTIENVGETTRPGIVHRLDKGTSGVMLAAKTEKTHQELVKMFQAHDLERKYLSLVTGEMAKPIGTINQKIGRHRVDRKKMSTNTKLGKEAITDFFQLATSDHLHLVRLTLHTGRTHQIRVHLSEVNRTPVLNDQKYAKVANQLKRVPIAVRNKIQDYEHPLLHAYFLRFKHPITNKELTFNCPPPQPFSDILNLLWSDLKI